LKRFAPIAVTLLAILLLAAWAPAARAAEVTNYLETIPVGQDPLLPASSTADGCVYVTNSESATLSEICNGSVTETLDLNYSDGSFVNVATVRPGAAGYDPDGGYLYVPFGATPNSVNGNSSGHYMVGLIDTSLDLDIGGIYWVPGEPLTPSYDGADHAMYVPVDAARLCTGATSARTCQQFSGVTVIGSVGPEIANVTLGAYADDLNPSPAYDPGNGYVYISDSTQDVVYVVSGTSLVATIPVGEHPGPVVYEDINPLYSQNIGCCVYVSNEEGDSVSVINGTSVVATIAVGDGPGIPGYDFHDNLLFVPNSLAGTVTVVYPNNNTVAETMVFQTPGVDESESGPGHPVYDLATDSVYIPDLESGQVTIISGDSAGHLSAIYIDVGSKGSQLEAPVVAENGWIFISEAKDASVALLSFNVVYATVSGQSTTTSTVTPCSGCKSVNSTEFPDDWDDFDENSSTTTSVSSTLYTSLSCSFSTTTSNTTTVSSSTAPGRPCGEATKFSESTLTPAGQPVTISVNGNITVNQFSSISLTQNSTTGTVDVSFILNGTHGTTGTTTITVPKSAIPTGYLPKVYINGTLASDQSYTQDGTNYYVTFSTQFSTHLVQIDFSSSSETTSATSSAVTSSIASPSASSAVTSSSVQSSSSSLPTSYLVEVALVAAVLLIATLVVRAKTTMTRR
jgi:YVTN family beta-propeller protein